MKLYLLIDRETSEVWRIYEHKNAAINEALEYGDTLEKSKFYIKRMISFSNLL